MKNTFLSFFLLVFAAVLTGCSHLVTVQTDPPGAKVRCRGYGRPAYKWDWKGTTTAKEPVTFKVPYSTINTYAVWPDGVASEIVETQLIFSEEPVITLKKPR